MVPDSRATVKAPAVFRTERCAGPQILITPPSISAICAVPDLTRTSLPLRSMVSTLPCTTWTFIGPLTAMASPSMTPIVSAGGLDCGLSNAACGEVDDECAGAADAPADAETCAAAAVRMSQRKNPVVQKIR